MKALAIEMDGSDGSCFKICRCMHGQIGIGRILIKIITGSNK